MAKSDLPAYEQVKAFIKQHIGSGEWRPGDPVPSESALMQQFGISRTPTVLLLDAGGAVRHRMVGPARRPDVVDALDQVTGRSADRPTRPANN